MSSYTHRQTIAFTPEESDHGDEEMILDQDDSTGQAAYSGHPGHAPQNPFTRRAEGWFASRPDLRHLFFENYELFSGILQDQLDAYTASLDHERTVRSRFDKPVLRILLIN